MVVCLRLSVEIVQCLILNVMQIFSFANSHCLGHFFLPRGAEGVLIAFKLSTQLILNTTHGETVSTIGGGYRGTGTTEVEVLGIGRRNGTRIIKAE